MVGMRSVYAPDAPRREVNWRVSGLCADNPDMWSADSQPERSRAAHVCLRHCPVLAECRADMERAPRWLLTSVVVAGVPHAHDGKAITWPLQPVPCGVECRRG